MYRNETLLLEGDSIWGSITLLLSSLLSRPCTGLERAQFYEHMLLKSLEKQDKAILLLLKFFESKLREAIDASDEIMRFYCFCQRFLIITLIKVKSKLRLVVRDPKYSISKNHAVTSTEPFTDRTNIPSIIYQSLYEDNKNVVVQQSCYSREKQYPLQYKHLDRNFLKNIECYEKIRRIIVDERGRIHPRACDPELRSLCKLRIGDVFYIVPWHEYLRCLVHVLMGEESILFRKNVMNTLLNIFYIMKITKGRMVSAVREFCDDVLVSLLRHYADFWENESIGLEESMLITKNFLDVWLFEGKFRKLVSYSPNLKQMVTEESNCVTVSKLIAELSEDKIRKALDSNMLGAVGSLLDFYFQKVYLSQHAIFIRCCIIDDFKQTARLLQDVYLCDDGHITEITMNVLINKGSDSELNSKSGNYQNFWLDEMMDYLLSKNYSSTLVHGFLQLTIFDVIYYLSAYGPFGEENGLKLRYKPPFPLNIIFAPSILMNYERIWNLLLRIAVECTALETICKKLYRHCLLGGKHVKLWNVLDECLALITKYRRSDLESFNILRLLKIFNDFQCNVDLFCNEKIRFIFSGKRTSVGANYWLSDFLLLADFSGIYNDLRDGFSLNLNRTRNS
ncbi:hypothetical protein DINM_022574 [Dirofilaria immitis]|nr:hypothetical protein [Dirofilaria immitis]